ncbi:hypothetical protein HY745_09965, partial [Candidatus Desantisbacteria bacterium]|nr:hypothetical protein [Candidatus Desantisbacteria bacterium]
HSIHNGIDSKMWNRQININAKMDVITKLCSSCHLKNRVGEKKLVGELTHPTDKTIMAVDRIPGMDLLPTFNFDGEKINKGKVYCNTCHDLHRWDPSKKEEGPGRNVEGDGSNSFLRVNNTKSELCQECHAKKKFAAGTKHDMKVAAPKSTNAMGQDVERSGICGACHVPHNASDYRLWARVPYVGEDIGTVLCLSCHSKNNVGEKKLVGQFSHPVNVVVNENPKVDGKTKLPLYTDKGIVMPSTGKIICMTCHDVHKWDPVSDDFGDGTLIEGNGSNSFLRKVNDNKGELCTDCHDSKKFVIGTDHDMSVTGINEKNYLGQPVSLSGACGACHSVHNAYIQLKLWGRIPGKNPDDRQMDLMATFCYSCHQSKSIGEAKVPETLFHPPKILVSTVGRGSKGKGSYWPVYNEAGDIVGTGMITCPTCHNVHKWQPDSDKQGINKNIEGDAINSFLRNKGASFSLCTDCHETDAIMRYKYYHIERNRKEHRGTVH